MMQKSRIRFPESHGMLHFAIWLVIFVILFAVGNHYISQVYDSAKLTEADAAVQSFASSVGKIHQNWILHGKPKQVVMTDVKEDGSAGNRWVILLNRSGWPINVLSGNGKPDCTALWLALQKNTRLTFRGEAVKMERKVDGSLGLMPFNPDIDEAARQGIWVCECTVAKKLRFRYRLDTGVVALQQG